MTEIKITKEKLEKIGGKYWEGGKHRRVYFNKAELNAFYGIEYTSYKTGNVSSAKLQGESISNSRAAKIVIQLNNCKFWYDLNAEKFQCYDLDWEIFEEIIDSIKNELNNKGE
jgi:hypothetical protein